LRRASATRGYYLPEIIFVSGNGDRAVEVLDAAFKLYEEMSANGIPNEDARYVLPLYTRTNIQTIGDARELTHLHSISDHGFVPSAARSVVEEMIAKASVVAPKLFKRRETNYETLAWYPAAQLYAPKNMTMESIIASAKDPDHAHFISHKLETETIMMAVQERDEAELANLKHSHNGSVIEGFLAPMSLAAFHQAIRQRTWDQSVESIFHAAVRGSYLIPPKIRNSAFADRFIAQTQAMQRLYHRLGSDGVPQGEAIGVMAHALIVYDLMHVNGWNAIHSIGKRTCTETQWEIREIANSMAKYLKCVNPALGSIVAPQGDVYSRCPERKPCGLCKKASNMKPNAAK
jgi:thymidylate synthase ThyX